MNFKKIDILLGMKDIQRLPNTPHHRGYNLLEHGCFNSTTVQLILKKNRLL